MARVLIIEPEADLRSLAGETLRELGHEPVDLDDEARCPTADVVLVAHFAGMAKIVQRLREADLELVTICAGTSSICEERGALRSVVHLVKPYGMRELERAVSLALAHLPRPG